MHNFSYCGLVGWDSRDYKIDEDTFIIYEVLIVFQLNRWSTHIEQSKIETDNHHKLCIFSLTGVYLVEMRPLLIAGTSFFHL